MVVIIIIGLLAGTLYVWTVPYMMRSRDTKRVTWIFQYTSILEAYEKNFDTFPSNYWSGWNPLSLWYCLSEIPTRPDVAILGNAWKFSSLYWWDTTPPPTDPDSSRLVSWCSLGWSYLYSKLLSSPSSEIFVIGANLEIRPSSNYGTWSDLLLPAKSQDIITAMKWTVPDSAPDQLFIVTKIR